jgi:hypothetical protein
MTYLPQETALVDTSKKDQANAQFKKLQRAEDGKKAMTEYQVEQVAARAQLERLKALRVARDLAAANAPAAPAVIKPAVIKAAAIKPAAAPKTAAAKKKARPAKPAVLVGPGDTQQGDGQAG